MAKKPLNKNIVSEIIKCQNTIENNFSKIVDRYEDITKTCLLLVFQKNCIFDIIDLDEYAYIENLVRSDEETYISFHIKNGKVDSKKYIYEYDINSSEEFEITGGSIKFPTRWLWENFEPELKQILVKIENEKIQEDNSKNAKDTAKKALIKKAKKLFTAEEQKILGIK